MTPSPPTPRLKKAPVVETRMMVQFAPLNGFRSGHFGLLWTECLGREGWGLRRDADIQPHLAERFDSPFLNPPTEPANVDATPCRMVLASPDMQRLFHFQPDQLSMTFRRQAEDCPTYEQVREQFGQVVGKVGQFAETNDIGPFVPDLWELTYVNVIPQGELWQTPADWWKVFPTLFPHSPQEIAGCQWGSFEGEWHFTVPPEFGRVHVRVTKSVANRSKQVVLLMVLTVRGPVGGGGAKTWEDGLDAAHTTAVRVFYNLASQTAKDFWEGKQ